MSEFTGRRVVVMGGSRGIGRSAAIAFARAGASVAICARGAETLEATRKELEAAGAPTAYASPVDLAKAEDIARFILDLKDELGVTVMMVEHDMGIVMDISDRVCVMNHGEKIAEGTPAEISDNPAVIDAYLGASRKGAA